MEMKKIIIILYAILLVVLIIFLTSCSGLETKEVNKGPLYRYKADMEIQIDNRTHIGMGSSDLSSSKKIKIKSEARLDVLIVSSCHRYDKYEKVGKKWYRGSQKDYTYQYDPTPIEKETACPIYIQAFDKSGVVDWGYIMFRTDQNLKARLECDGNINNTVGISLCQVKSGLDQAITFDQPIKAYSADGSCNLKQVSKTKFTIRPQVGFCNAEFSDGKDYHSLTMLGYDEIFIRGE